MPDPLSNSCTAFAGFTLIKSGPLIETALAVKAAQEREPEATIQVFADATGAIIDLDLRGSVTETVSRLADWAKREAAAGRAGGEARKDANGEETASQAGRGRPKLGVVAREVTLLPRHWEWLATQPGGASQALRRLVEKAQRGDGGRSKARAAQEACYRFMSAMAGNLPGFEEAARALFAGSRDRFTEETASWPTDVRAYAERLAWPEAAAAQAESLPPRQK